MLSPVHLLRKVSFTREIMVREYKKRARQIVRRIVPYIAKNEKVLDIGTGTGFVAQGMMRVGRKNIICTDVRLNPLNESGNVLIYNGKRLPFPDKSFDTVLLITVLHHCKKPLKVLDEALRVSSKKVIIMEDIFESSIEKILTLIEDSIVNWEFKGHPHSNKTENGWLDVFKQKRLNIINFQKFRLVCAGFPFRIGIFVLEKNKKSKLKLQKSQKGHLHKK